MSGWLPWRFVRTALSDNIFADTCAALWLEGEFDCTPEATLGLEIGAALNFGADFDNCFKGLNAFNQ
jgi:hypothetical protein